MISIIGRTGVTDTNGTAHEMQYLSARVCSSLARTCATGNGAMFLRRYCYLHIIGLSATGLFGGFHVSAQVPSANTGRSATLVDVAPSCPYLGVQAASAGEPAARQLGIESPSGAVVLATDVAGPCDAAGLRRGDLIVEFAGKEITQVNDLVAALGACPVGSSQTIVYVRGMERRSARIVVSSRAANETEVAPPATPPSTSPIDQGPLTSLTQPQPPTGWVERSVGNLIVYLPPDWTAVPFLASDEGCWFRGPSDAKEAVFAVVRDVPKEELLGPMKVEREEPTTFAGRAAAGCFGPTIEQQIHGTGWVLLPSQREADRSLLAVLCFAANDRWKEYESIFRTIVLHMRSRPPSQ